MSATRFRAFGTVLLFCAIYSPLAAQSCGNTESCLLGGRAAEATHAATMLAAGGGNPWLGNPSTLGFRTVTFPRLGGQFRTGYTRFDVPGNAVGELSGASAFAVSGAFSMALLDGFSPAATVGGTGSVDVFGNAGVVFLPGDAGFGSTSPFTWSVGARIGIFRESFTLPGITASVAYRGVGSTRFDRAALLQRETGFSWEGASAWQMRGVVGKRLAGIGLSGGVGWDTGSAETTIAYREPGGSTTAIQDLDVERFQAFLGLNWTSLIFSLGAEAGWQFGTDEDPTLAGRDPASPGRGFVALAARMTF